MFIKEDLRTHKRLFSFPFWWQAFLTGKVVCVYACMLKMGANYNRQYLSSHKSLDCITLLKRFYKLGVLWKCMFLSQRGIQKIFQLYITPERSTSAFMWYSFKHLFKVYMWRSEDSLQESVLTFYCVSSGNSSHQTWGWVLVPAAASQWLCVTF